MNFMKSAISQSFLAQKTCSRARFEGHGYGNHYPYPYPSVPIPATHLGMPNPCISLAEKVLLPAFCVKSSCFLCKKAAAFCAKSGRCLMAACEKKAATFLPAFSAATLFCANKQCIVICTPTWPCLCMNTAACCAPTWPSLCTNTAACYAPTRPSVVHQHGRVCASTRLGIEHQPSRALCTNTAKCCAPTRPSIVHQPG